MKAVDGLLGRIIPCVAIVLAAAALVVSLGGSGPDVPSEQAEAGRKLASLEEALTKVSAKLDSIDAHVKQAGSTPAAGRVSLGYSGDSYHQ